MVDGSRSVSELAAAEGKDPNGSYSKALKDLQYAGFVSEETGISPLTGKPLKETRYRIRDNYSRFYLKNIEPRASVPADRYFDFLLPAEKLLGGYDFLR